MTGAEEFRHKIQKLAIEINRYINTCRVGEMRSLNKGSGIEFEELKEYYPSDDPRRIVFKKSIILPEIIVRKFRETKELDSLIILDLSPSMFFGKDPTKLELAFWTCAALGLSAVKRPGKLGLICFGKEKIVKPNLRNESNFLHTLLSIYKSVIKKDWILASSIVNLDQVLKDKTIRISGHTKLIFILSDFLGTENFEEILRLLIREAVIGVMIEREEKAIYKIPRGFGLTDPENKNIKISIDSSKSSAKAVSLLEKRRYDLKRIFDSSGAKLVCLDKEDDIFTVLNTFFLLQKHLPINP